MEFADIVQKRHATKLFSGEQLPQEDINELLEMVQYSASSYGLQPYKVIVINNQDLQEQLKEASYGQEQLSTASHVLVFCAYPEITKRIDQYQEMLKENRTYDQAQKNYIQSMRSSVGSQDAETQLEWSQRQLYIALGNAINGAKAIGYDSCPMEGFSKEQYKKILDLDENLHPTAVVTVGVAADEQQEKLRYSKEELFIHKN
jgi:nitroreductase